MSFGRSAKITPMKSAVLDFGTERYCPDWMCEFDDSYSPYSSEMIPLGASRVGGHVFDYPTSFDIPGDATCVAQLNLKDISHAVADSDQALPNVGHLYFFTIGQQRSEIVCRVIHTDHDSTPERVVGDGTFAGRVVTGLNVDEESWDSRFIEDETGGRSWNPFAGDRHSKLFGFPTNCQWTAEDVTEAMKSRTLLLQIGADITPEGTVLFMIDTAALNRADFSNVEMLFGMS